MGLYLNKFRLDGNVTVATGASGYLCKNFITAAAQAGSDIAAIDIPSAQEKLESILREIEDTYHVRAKGYYLDITEEEAIKDASKEILREFTHIDGLINAAGINHHGRIEDYTIHDFMRLMQVNIAGTFACCKYFGAEMCKKKKGSIINIASYAGSVISKVPRTMAGYDVSKAGVIHLTKAIASEFGEYQVRCNSVSPGFLEKGMSNVKNFKMLQENSGENKRLQDIPMKRVATAEEMVGAVLYFLSDASTYTTGVDLVVDGGLHVW